MEHTKIYIADRIFTGDNWLNNHAIITTGKIIKDIVPLSALSSLQQAERFDNCMIAPAFIDLQIYGAYRKLLAVYPEADSLFKLKNIVRKGERLIVFLLLLQTPTKYFINVLML